MDVIRHYNDIIKYRFAFMMHYAGIEMLYSRLCIHTLSYQFIRYTVQSNNSLKFMCAMQYPAIKPSFVKLSIIQCIK